MVWACAGLIQVSVEHRSVEQRSIEPTSAMPVKVIVLLFLPLASNGIAVIALAQSLFVDGGVEAIVPDKGLSANCFARTGAFYCSI
mgnify:CR=1 FL=1